MKRPIHISTTFSSIKKMPLEVSFQQVENWVEEHPINISNKRNWLSYFIANWWRTLHKN